MVLLDLEGLFGSDWFRWFRLSETNTLLVIWSLLSEAVRLLKVAQQRAPAGPGEPSAVALLTCGGRCEPEKQHVTGQESCGVSVCEP